MPPETTTFLHKSLKSTIVRKALFSPKNTSHFNNLYQTKRRKNEWTKTSKPTLQYLTQSLNRNSLLLSIQEMNTRTNIFIITCTMSSTTTACVCRISIGTDICAMPKTAITIMSHSNFFKKIVKHDTCCQA